MLRTVVFVVFWGALLRPTAGGVVLHPKIHYAAKRSLATCQHTGVLLGDFVVVFPRDICREHSLIGRRNYLMAEAANSL